MKNVRSSLWPILERCRTDVPPDTPSLLFDQLGSIGKTRTTEILHAYRPIALELAGTKAARERQKLVSELALERPYLVFYAAAAWTARTLALAEYIERADLAILPKKWAGEQALSMMKEFEDDET
jgi:hypothetical protein